MSVLAAWEGHSRDRRAVPQRREELTMVVSRILADLQENPGMRAAVVCSSRVRSRIVFVEVAARAEAVLQVRVLRAVGGERIELVNGSGVVICSPEGLRGRSFDRIYTDGTVQPQVLRPSLLGRRGLLVEAAF